MLGGTMALRPLTTLLFLGFSAASVRAQENFNFAVQVSGSELVQQGVTMVERHSNFTPSGYNRTFFGVLPTNHAQHETVEITHGFNDWFECGYYIFTSFQADGPERDWMYVGSHIRPRIAVPEKYRLTAASAFRTRSAISVPPSYAIPGPGSCDPSSTRKSTIGVGVS